MEGLGLEQGHQLGDFYEDWGEKQPGLELG